MEILKKIKRKITKGNTNLIVAGSALFISACALLISVQEIRIMRTQQKATMYPYVTLGTMYNGDGFGFRLKNSGNGLAKINSYRVMNDSIYFKDWFDVLQTVIPEAKNIDYSIITTAGNIRNEIVTPGETVNLLFLKWTPETRILEERIRDLKIEISYSSLLEEHWVISEGIPKELDGPYKIKTQNEFGY